jgi:hypothetical protein
MLALIAMSAPTPTLAASNRTDVSAAQRRNVQRAPVARIKSQQFRPQRAVGPTRAVVRGNRAGPGVVQGPGRGPRGVRNVRGGPNVQGLRPGRLGVGPGRAGTVGPRLGNIPRVTLRGNRFATVYRGPRRFFFGGRWRSFLPLTALGVVAIGGAYYYADAYLAVGRPYCEGITPNGCRLNWQMVAFDDGDGEWQCVQYCPRPGAIPPPRTVALIAPPAAAQGRCEITIYSEPKFAGAPVPTSEDQPRLSESGWQHQIASVDVKAGTWEMFTEEQYTGGAMRLAPGPYPDLGPDWTKKISSFMCVEPGG